RDNFLELDRKLSKLKKHRKDADYYAVTLTADDDLKMVFATQTHWVGWADKDMRVELREASLVRPEAVIETWKLLKLPFSVIHDPNEMILFMIGGGNALIEKNLAE